MFGVGQPYGNSVPTSSTRGEAVRIFETMNSKSRAWHSGCTNGIAALKISNQHSASVSDKVPYV